MKSTPRRAPKAGAADMRSEYIFDYSKAKPNRFAPQFRGGGVAVVLEPDERPPVSRNRWPDER